MTGLLPSYIQAFAVVGYLEKRRVFWQTRKNLDLCIDFNGLQAPSSVYGISLFECEIPTHLPVAAF
jgi:hypothetical protein